MKSVIPDLQTFYSELFLRYGTKIVLPVTAILVTCCIMHYHIGNLPYITKHTEVQSVKDYWGPSQYKDTFLPI